MSALLVDQPAPVQEERDNPACWPLVIAGEADAGLVADMMARDELGRSRYGVPLRVWNGRDALADAYQEGLDLVVYLEQCRQRTEDVQARLELLVLRNEALSMLKVMQGLQGKVPVQQFRAHRDSPTAVVPP